MEREFVEMIPVARYAATTNGIKVSVVATPIAEECRPEERAYAFAYTVTIENVGAGRCQLIERHWYIFSGGEQIGDIVGPGVVGQKPVLQIGESYTYTSSAVIHDPFGEMFGTYLFQLTDGSYFEVEIPRFDLAYPDLMH